MGQPATLTKAANITRTSINGTTATHLRRGWPVMRKVGRTELPEVDVPDGAGGLGAFAGILDDDILSNSIGDQHSSALVIEGQVLANIYVPTASAAVVGAALLPVTRSGVPYLQVITGTNTGIRLLEDLTAQSDGAELLVTAGQGKWVEIAPGVVDGPVRHYYWPTANAQTVEAAFATSATLVTTVAEEDLDVSALAVPSNLKITPGGTTTDVAEMSITVTGTNILDEVITEAFAFAANASSATVGVKIFKTVTGISVPAQDGAAATFAVATEKKLGLYDMFAAKPVVLEGRLAGTIESTKPTAAGDVDDIESNYLAFDSAPNGTAIEAWVLVV